MTRFLSFVIAMIFFSTASHATAFKAEVEVTAYDIRQIGVIGSNFSDPQLSLTGLGDVKIGTVNLTNVEIVLLYSGVQLNDCKSIAQQSQLLMKTVPSANTTWKFTAQDVAKGDYIVSDDQKSVKIIFHETQPKYVEIICSSSSE